MTKSDKQNDRLLDHGFVVNLQCHLWKGLAISNGITSFVRRQLTKFPTNHDIGTVRRDQPTSRSCYYAQVRNKG